jgi:cytochrome c peroxidase
MRLARFGLVVCLPLALAAAACQPAGRFTPPRLPAKEKDKETPPSPTPTDFDLTWQRPNREWEKGNRAVGLVFVDRKLNPDLWARLPADRIWHEPLPKPSSSSPLFGPLPDRAVTILLDQPEWRSILIRVPLGLPNPSGRLPAVNPPTKAKWLLGKRLFFDRSWMTPNGLESCADCHQPERGYADGKKHGGVRTPSLLNCVYNDTQFADGRATDLEEVVGSSPVDEPEPGDGSFRHAWGGVERLRKNPTYVKEFFDAFGSPPTQDAVGKALATYLRTLLSGNSLHDRAAVNGKPTAEDYQRVLSDPQAQAAFRRLLDTPDLPLHKDLHVVELSLKLADGWRRFEETGKGSRTQCVACHSGKDSLGEMTFSDQRFHNLGVGAPFEPKDVGAGRFSRVPVGVRERHQVGAFKTPRLRSLVGVGPYLHDGSSDSLRRVIDFHLAGGTDNDFLDPVMLDIKDQYLKSEVRPEDREAARDLTLLLLALQGDPPEDFIRKP